MIAGISMRVAGAICIHSARTPSGRSSRIHEAPGGTSERTIMDAFPGHLAAELQENEIDLLRSVFGKLCAEYNIAAQGEQTEHLARFLVNELRRGISDEDSLLDAARQFHSSRA